jgi:hypothetical protein
MYKIYIEIVVYLFSHFYKVVIYMFTFCLLDDI